MGKNVLRLAEHLTGPFVYIDCGARGDPSHEMIKVFSDARYIGFEPDIEECEKLSLNARNGHSFYPIAIGKQTEQANLFVTKNLGCSSLYAPNSLLFEPFQECAPFFEVLTTRQIQVVALDEYLPEKGIRDIDFLELDTQGAELDILYGAKNFLKETLVGVKAEVEFSEMYQNQPMFADVDSWLRQNGFMLFDLERYHLRRKSCPQGVDSREQIIWGQALYLRDFRFFQGSPAVIKQKLSKLAVVASYYDFHSYALDILNYLMKDARLLTIAEKNELEHVSIQYISQLKNNRIVRWMQSLDRSSLHKTFRRWGSTFAKFYEAYRFVTGRQKYFWKD